MRDRPDGSNRFISDFSNTSYRGLIDAKFEREMTSPRSPDSLRVVSTKHFFLAADFDFRTSRPWLLGFLHLNVFSPNSSRSLLYNLDQYFFPSPNIGFYD